MTLGDQWLILVILQENPADEDAQIVEKILGMRQGKRAKPVVSAALAFSFSIYLKVQ